MATTGIMNGTDLKIKLTGSAIAYLTSNGESYTNSLRETTNKDSGGNAQYAYGKFSGTWDAELLHVEGGTNGYSFLFGAMTGRTILAAEVTTGETGDKKYTCSVLVGDVKRSAPMEDNTGITCTLTITGAVTEATI
jgi:hypothetical protein